MFKLDFKASNIRNGEKEYNVGFFDAIMRIGGRQISVTDLMFLYACGGASDEDFDKDFHSKAGMQNIVVNIFETVDEAGFLGQDLDIKALKEALGVKDEDDSSTKSGKTTKA